MEVWGVILVHFISAPKVRIRGVVAPVCFQCVCVPCAKSGAGHPGHTEKGRVLCGLLCVKF